MSAGMAALPQPEASLADISWTASGMTSGRIPAQLEYPGFMGAPLDEGPLAGPDVLAIVQGQADDTDKACLDGKREAVSVKGSDLGAPTSVNLAEVAVN
jgi:hypothetical protein